MQGSWKRHSLYAMHMRSTPFFPEAYSHGQGILNLPMHEMLFKSIDWGEMHTHYNIQSYLSDLRFHMMYLHKCECNHCQRNNFASDILPLIALLHVAHGCCFAELSQHKLTNVKWCITALHLRCMTALATMLQLKTDPSIAPVLRLQAHHRCCTASFFFLANFSHHLLLCQQPSRLKWGQFASSSDWNAMSSLPLL